MLLYVVLEKLILIILFLSFCEKIHGIVVVLNLLPIDHIQFLTSFSCQYSNINTIRYLKIIKMMSRKCGNRKNWDTKQIAINSFSNYSVVKLECFKNLIARKILLSWKCINRKFFFVLAFRKKMLFKNKRFYVPPWLPKQLFFLHFGNVAQLLCIHTFKQFWIEKFCISF